jgi:hypothetical protein
LLSFSLLGLAASGLTPLCRTRLGFALLRLFALLRFTLLSLSALFGFTLLRFTLLCFALLNRALFSRLAPRLSLSLGLGFGLGLSLGLSGAFRFVLLGLTSLRPAPLGFLLLCLPLLCFTQFCLATRRGVALVFRSLCYRLLSSRLLSLRLLSFVVLGFFFPCLRRGTYIVLFGLRAGLNSPVLPL